MLVHHADVWDRGPDERGGIARERTMFDRVKRIFWNLWLDSRGVEHGALFSMIPPCYFYTENGGTIRLGDHLSLNRNVAIDASDGGTITIGDHV